VSGVRTPTAVASGSTRAALVRWPAEADRRAALAAAGVARLLVVDPGTPIPAVTDGEDWISSASDERDVAARLVGLAWRAPAVERTVPPVLPGYLSDDARRVARRLLLAPGALVRRDDLAAEDLTVTLRSLRPTLRSLGWVVVTIGRAGYLLAPAPEPAP
jgi:hypothetical protein